MPKLKNIIIFVAIGAIFVLVYVFFIKKSPEESIVPLVSTSAEPGTNNASDKGVDVNLAKDFLALLLSVKDIRLNDAIFSDVAFTSLDSSHSIDLTPDGTEGRANPFAPFGADTTTSLPSQ